jgi:acyl-CoA reductase-like NAD-dependent aldehyde dehydrogenase
LCSPANLALCDEEQTAAIVAIQALTDAELDEKIAAADKATKDAETTFDTELAALQATYKALQETKEKAIAAVKDSGIGYFDYLSFPRFSRVFRFDSNLIQLPI